MVVVAIAGGTGSVGRTFREVLETNPNHKVVTLARKAGDGVVAADYADVDATARTLRDHDVHTVLCTMDVGDAASSDAQLRLIEAAAAAGNVKRFVVSEWGVVHGPNSPFYGFREQSYAALRKTSLEWTRVANGFFMDFWGIPRGLKSQMKPMADWSIDIGHRKAAIPGDGNQVLCLTYTYDVARYLSAWLELADKWEETTYLYGDRTTWNEFLKEAETATGTKFDVVYDDVDKLSRGELTELPSHVPVYQFLPKPALQGFLSMFSKWTIEGVFDFPEDKAITKKFPDIQTKKIRDVVALWKE